MNSTRLAAAEGYVWLSMANIKITTVIPTTPTRLPVEYSILYVFRKAV